MINSLVCSERCMMINTRVWSWLSVCVVLVIAACRAPEPVAQRWCDRLPRPAYAQLERVPVSQDWFEVYRVADGVLAIYEPFQFQEVISYLIVGTQRALLFDTGMGIGRIDKVVAELTALPVRVLNSHGHLDHIGGNAAFDFIYARDTEFSRTRARGMRGDAVLAEVSTEALCRPLPDGVKAASYRIAPYRITQRVGDGDRIALGGRELEVLAVPGHTDDSIALLERATGTLWTGDSFYEGPIWLFAPETDLVAYRESIDRLAALVPDLKQLLTAHNTPLAAPERLEQLAMALRTVAAGKRAPDSVGERTVEYEFNGFSLLMQKPETDQQDR